MVSVDTPVQDDSDEEVVDVRFIPDDQTSVFSITSPTMLGSEVIEQAEEFDGHIKFGDVIRMRRGEALARQDFQIVGEEDTTTSPLANPQVREVTRVQEVPGDRSVVAPPPAPSTEATVDSEEN